MKLIKKIALVLLGVFVLMQFYRPAKNLEATPTANHIESVTQMPENVKAIMQKACYDCHSNNTKYPWYSNIAPVSWFMNNHVVEGKEELNFSEWNTYSQERKSHKAEEVIEEVEENKMPLKSYTITHRDAILTNAEKQTLNSWFKTLIVE